jgi:three-Cys-motif partner protein
LAATKGCDVWYLFPLGGVIRMMTNSGEIPAAWSTMLDRLLGTHDWHGEFYKPNPQQSLFESDNEALLKDASTQHVVDYIRSRLSSVFPAVSDAGVLRNSKGAPLFALVLGVSSTSPAAQKAALAIANHLVKDLNQL